MSLSNEQEVFSRLNSIEKAQAVDQINMKVLEKSLEKVEARIDARLDIIEGFASRILWALAVGAVGILIQLGVFWIKTVRTDERSNAPFVEETRNAQR